MGTQDMCSVSVCKRKGRRKEVSRRWRRGRVGSCEHTSLLFCTEFKCSFLRPRSALISVRNKHEVGPQLRWQQCRVRERIWKELERDSQQLVTSPDRKQKEKHFPRLENRTAAVACSRGDCNTTGSSNLHCLPKFAHVHWVSCTIWPSHSLPPPSPFAFSLS